MNENRDKTLSGGGLPNVVPRVPQVNLPDLDTGRLRQEKKTDCACELLPASRIQTTGDIPMRRWSFFIYGVCCHLLFFVTFAYMAGFVSNLLVPKSIDSAPADSLGAVGFDLLLIGLFGLQHSIMARPWFKRTWTQLVPQPIERSTYCKSKGGPFASWDPRPPGGGVPPPAGPPGPPKRGGGAGRWAGFGAGHPGALPSTGGTPVPRKQLRCSCTMS